MFKKFVIFLAFGSLAICQEENALKFFNYNDFKHQIRNLRNINITTSCNEQLTEIFTNNSQILWDLFDSSSKFPWSGLSTATIRDFGSYDQCVNINHKYSEGKITGKYCLYGLLIPNNFSSVADDVANNNFNDWYKLGVCMPEVCTAEDYNNIFNLPFFNDVSCHTKEEIKKLSIADISMIAVLVCFGVIIIISTTYDVYLYKKQKKSPHLMLVAFSIFTNGRKLLQTSKGNREQIQIFNGIKSISMAWIVAGHGINSWDSFNVINRRHVESYKSHLEAAYVSTSFMAVDTFFYMSGFLLAYTYMKQKSKPVALQIKSIPLMIIHRYIRLTPAVVMLYFFTITIFPHMGTGPLWKYGVDQIVTPCHKHWWPFFLYIQNYYNYQDFCLIHTWYLSADMQMYILSPIILIPLAALLAKNKKNFNIVMLIMLFINIFFIVLPITLKLIYTSYESTFDTHSRAINYTMGIMLGIFMREKKDKPFLHGKIKPKSLVNLIIWAIALILLLAVSLIQQEITNNFYDHTAVSLTHSLMRPAWCLSLSWMVYSSYYGYGGIVNWILTRPTLQITAKLSYCMYLVHGLVVTHFVMISRTRTWFENYMVFINWCGFFIVSWVGALIWSLAFESPLIIIERIIFGGTTRKPKQEKPTQSVEEGTEVGSTVVNGNSYSPKENYKIL